MNLIELCDEVSSRYKRYLSTMFYFKDPELRRSFQDALSSGDLSKGPYLEATPVFRQGLTPSALFGEFRNEGIDKGFLNALQGDRPLYRHQEEAIRRVIAGHNVIVATGTASGKTEAFLFPILFHLYREFEGGSLGSGVRALILYPMNALANDQRERLGKICERLQHYGSSFQFTFGQYIGETPEDESDSRRNARSYIENRLPGELVLRSEMRDTPPNILLTNYSMLEYLLLRPHDSPLFDNGRARWWTFLVLDEAHQYRGARGIEMAMLIRRLKQRLREGGRQGPFRCIATSATLLRGPEDRPAVAQFASKLFGEPFAGEHVILAETEPVQEGQLRLEPAHYRELWSALQSNPPTIETLVPQLGSLVGLPISAAEDTALLLGSLLSQDERSCALRQEVSSGCKDIVDLSNRLFSELPAAERVKALSQLVDLLVQAADPNTKAPLLSARYHFFLRSLEGAFVSYFPAKQVFLERRGSDPDQTPIEIALCRECGQHYFVGRVSGGYLREAIRDPSDPDFGAVFYRPVEQNLDFEQGDEDTGDSKAKLFRLCLQCGSLAADTRAMQHSPCNHTGQSILVAQQEAAREKLDQIPRCSVCGYQAPDPVREVVHGADGPHAVIATTLVQHLAPNRQKVLAFADSRQDAAFFAWYLDSTYRDILHRHLLYQAITRLAAFTPMGLTFGELAVTLRDLYREKSIFPPTFGDLETRREAWIRLYREFLTDETRISLEGVGLWRWLIEWPTDFPLPDVLKNEPWSLSDKEGRDLLLVLLNSMRTDAAVELIVADNVPVAWDDLELRASQRRFRVGAPRGQQRVSSWDGPRTQRVRFLVKLLAAQGASEDEAQAVKTLRYIWEAFARYDGSRPSNARLLLTSGEGKRLNPFWWRAHLITSQQAVFQCNVCARISPVSVRGICPRPSCPGRLVELSPDELEPNHYRTLYQESLPGLLRVEEHTAQLAYEKAREFQREFRQGDINVLSSSTTFELGVDLGDLDCVFLRNVPPEAFNYAQRVGRSGRRPGRPGLAITYCRRSPHDLYHFVQPEQVISGQIRPPVLNITNRKILIRHMSAAVLSKYFRARHDRFVDVRSLFGDMAQPSVADDLRNFLQSHRSDLRSMLMEIVPSEMAEQLGLHSAEWIEEIVGDNSQLKRAEIEVSNDYREVANLESERAARGDYRTAAWAQARARTISTEDVLSFLSRKAVIPKYGFPVDVVELDTHRTQQSSESMEVALQRDLAIAIAEFAPTCEVVANKKQWRSHALKRVPEREWPRKSYRRCTEHNTFESWTDGGQAQVASCCPRAVTGSYVVPRFGFLADRSGPKVPIERPIRLFTTRPYFAGFESGPSGVMTLGAIRLTKATPGTLVMLCEGRRGSRFFICPSCGAGFRTRETAHKTAFGVPCSGTLEPLLSLGHELLTDVVRIECALPLDSHGDDARWLAHAVAYSLVQGASAVLEIPPTDLSATVSTASGTGSLPSLILYDDVPGGAGLVARLEEQAILRESLIAARDRLSGICGCSIDASCYGCIRSYRNQFAHPYLKRGLALCYLERLLESL